MPNGPQNEGSAVGEFFLSLVSPQFAQGIAQERMRKADQDARLRTSLFSSLSTNPELALNKGVQTDVTRLFGKEAAQDFMKTGREAQLVRQAQEGAALAESQAQRQAQSFFTEPQQLPPGVQGPPAPAKIESPKDFSKAVRENPELATIAFPGLANISAQAFGQGGAELGTFNIGGRQVTGTTTIDPTTKQATFIPARTKDGKIVSAPTRVPKDFNPTSYSMALIAAGWDGEGVPTKKQATKAARLLQKQKSSDRGDAIQAKADLRKRGKVRKGNRFEGAENIENADQLLTDIARNRNFLLDLMAGGALADQAGVDFSGAHQPAPAGPAPDDAQVAEAEAVLVQLLQLATEEERQTFEALMLQLQSGQNVEKVQAQLSELVAMLQQRAAQLQTTTPVTTPAAQTVTPTT